MQGRVEFADLARDIETMLDGLELRPTLIIASADDMLVPSRNASFLAHAIGTAELAIFPWDGHAANVTAADRFYRPILSSRNRLDT